MLARSLAYRSFRCPRKFIPKSIGQLGWFQVPLPFARCDIRMGEPVWVDRKGDEWAGSARRQIQERMMALTTD